MITREEFMRRLDAIRPHDAANWDELVDLLAALGGAALPDDPPPAVTIGDLVKAYRESGGARMPKIRITPPPQHLKEEGK